MTTILRKQALHPEWDKRLDAMSKEVGVVDASFTGVLELQYNRGGLSGVVKKPAQEKLK